MGNRRYQTLFAICSEFRPQAPEITAIQAASPIDKLSPPAMAGIDAALSGTGVAPRKKLHIRGRLSTRLNSAGCGTRIRALMLTRHPRAMKHTGDY